MARRRKGNSVHGWLVLDKPEGLSSNQALGAVKRLLNPAKIGHAGTLDPLATGVLPLALGEATKLVSHAMAGAKTYEVTIAWGEERDTDDREGRVTETSHKRPERAAILAALDNFTGEIMQKPPGYSALKVAGKRAYAMARGGDMPDLPARLVRIDALSLEECDTDTATLRVTCGKGTYIRALARDLARHLGTVGHVAKLRRTRVGPFSQEAAFSLDKLDELGHIAALEQALLPIETPLDDIPAVAVMDSEADRLRQGQAVRLSSSPQKAGGEPDLPAQEVLITASGSAIGLGLLQDGILRPKRVFNF